MTLFNILYYQIFAYYVKRSSYINNHYNAMFTMSVCLGSLIIWPLNIYLMIRKCYLLNTLVMFLIPVAIFVFMFCLFFKTGRAEKVVCSKPKLFKSNIASGIVAICFFLLAVSFYFWCPVYLRTVYAECNKLH